MSNLKEYKLLGTYLENVMVYHVVPGCNHAKTIIAGRSVVGDPSVAELMEWIEEHEKQVHTPKPLTQEQKIESRKRWDAKFEEGQKRG